MKVERCAIYRRISTSNQEENTSLDVQNQACRTHASEKGYAVVADYCDVHSGADLWHREHLQRLINAAEDGEFDVVVIYHTDRLSREADHLAFIRVQLKRSGVRVESVMNPRTDSFEDKLMSTFEALFAQHERVRIQSRMAAGRRHRIEKEQRLQPGSEPLLGYGFDDPAPGAKNAYVEDPKTSWIVKRAFRDYVAGKSLREIANQLNDEGIPTSRGRKWTGVQINRIIRHPYYRGLTAANRYTSFIGENGTRLTRERPVEEWVWTPGVAPALVDDELWITANERLGKNKLDKTRPYDQREDALLRAGFVFCKDCGGGMSVHRQHGRVYYRCRHAHLGKSDKCKGKCVEASKIDKFVWSSVESWIADPGVIEAEIRKNKPRLNDGLLAEVTTVKAGVEQVQSEQQRLVDTLSRLDGFAQQPVLDRLNQLGAQLVAQQAQLDEAQARLDAATNAESVVEDVWKSILDFADGVENWTYQQKREFLDRMGAKVTIEKMDVGIFRLWLDVEPPWPDGTAWWDDLFGGLQRGPFALAGDNPAVTNATTIFMGTVWTANTLLARQMAYLRQREQQDDLQRVFLVPWQRVAQDLPVYGARVRARIDQLGETHPFVQTEYFLKELDGQQSLFPPQRLELLRGTHPRQHRAAVGKRYALLLDVAGEEESGGDAVHSAGRRDSTALTVVEVDLRKRQDGRPLYRVVDRRAWTGVRHTDLHAHLVELATRVWHASWIVVDATGIGAGLASFLQASLRRTGSQVIPFTFTASSKSQLGWDFVSLIETGRYLEYMDDGDALTREFYDQMLATEYSVRRGPGNAIQWGVPAHVGHDDLVLSAALVGVLDDIDPRPRIAIGT